MHHCPRIRTCTALFALLLLPTVTCAKVAMSIDVGWNNRYRAGEWTPLYITAGTDGESRQVFLELYSPTDSRYAMKVTESFAVGPSGVTVPLYVPLSYRLDETTATLRDANSGRFLVSIPLSDYSAYARVGGTPDAVQADHVFIGISGNASTERLIESQFNQQNIAPTYLPPARLPAVPVGYDSLDLLILNQPDLGRIDADQQHAIMDWVRAGGTLLLWPGTDPLPDAGPIIEMLPCKLGKIFVYELPPQAVEAKGLPARFAKITGRAVTGVAGDAKTISLFGGENEKLLGYRHWVGFGQIVVVPADLSTLQFADAAKSVAFWRDILAGVITLPKVENNAGYNYYDMEANPRQMYAVRKSLDWMGDIPGAGQFGFSYIAAVLIALMIIVGPVDWFVLKWLGRQPWTWITISGWIGLVTLSAIYIGHIFKSGDLHYRTVTLLDEAGGARAASADLIGIYSPQTTTYDMAFDADSWWRPASDAARGGGGLQIEIPCHQDYHGNRPRDNRLLINVWNLRFLRADESAPAAPTITAKLTLNGNGELDGTITNQSESPMTIVAIRTGKGTYRCEHGGVQAGASLQVSGKLNPKDKAFATTQVSAQERYRYYQNDGEATTRPVFPTAGDIAAVRSDRIEQMLKDEPQLACVYAQFEAPPADRVKLLEGGAKTQHLAYVRAIVPIEGQ